VEAGKAVDLFTQSLNVAPWYAEAYYNRALARETAGQFTEAMADLKLYLEFKLTETERREAQDKIYALKADAQLAIAKKAKEQNAADAAESKKKADNAAVLARTKKSIEGAWFSNVPGFSTPSFVVTRSGNDFKVEMPGGKNAFGDQLVARNIEAAETSLRFTYEVYVGTPVTYDLKREGDDLLVGQTIVNKTTKLSTERLTRKPWTGAP
jgi:tetratricopeptide (TPR) repeat protein